jgi:ABC-type sugar transport system permease subunit
LRSAAYFLYTRTFNDLAIGQGAAASWILAAIILTLTVMQFRYSKWVNYEV